MDFFQEYIVKRKIGVKEWILSILISIVAFVLVALSVPYLNWGFVAVLDAAVVYFSYVLISRFSVEFEYILTNSELDIDKIYARRKRDKMLTVDVRKLEICAPYGDEGKFSTEIMSNVEAIYDFSTRNYQDAYLAIYFEDGKKYGFLFNPSQKMIDSMKGISPEKVF